MFDSGCRSCEPGIGNYAASQGEHDLNKLGNSKISAISSAVSDQHKELVTALLKPEADSNFT